jgi:hypothetical protein
MPHRHAAEEAPEHPGHTNGFQKGHGLAAACPSTLYRITMFPAIRPILQAPLSPAGP